LTFQTNGLIHETGIIFSKKNYKAQFLTNLISNDEIKKKIKKNLNQYIFKQGDIRHLTPRGSPCTNKKINHNDQSHINKLNINILNKTKKIKKPKKTQGKKKPLYVNYYLQFNNDIKK
jgi:hypothetical protein